MAELLERADALASLQNLLQEAVTRGRVALIAGEAGIGKSSLLEAAAAAHGTVWWDRCDAWRRRCRWPPGSISPASSVRASPAFCPAPAPCGNAVDARLDPLAMKHPIVWG